ncbi:MAG TPA: NADPH:quinone reductase [Tepidisphaeraceae bacterium]|nr:NADPH:quinone reductase [Tepidisphaeraceae bacterium]
MKAIRVHQPGPPDVMKLEDVPDPVAGTGQVLVEVKAAGVNPVEVYIRAGTYSSKAPMPYTPGGDAAGIVRSVGPGVSKVKSGDRVYTSATLTGAYAELALCNEANVHPLSDSITFPQGAGVNVPYATAWRALFIRTRAMAGETILIHGASGGVGIAAVQLCTAAGLTVFGTAGTERGLALIARQGASRAFNHTLADYQDQIRQATGGRGVDLVLEMLANVNLNADLDLLAKGGRVVVVGSRGPVQIDARRTMSKDSAIIGMSLMNVTPSELTAIHAALGAGLANGTLRPIVGREFPLRDAPKAHELVMSPGAHGKIVLIP